MSLKQGLLQQTEGVSFLEIMEKLVDSLVSKTDHIWDLLKHHIWDFGVIGKVEHEKWRRNFALKSSLKKNHFFIEN